MILKSEALPLLNSLGASATPFQFYCDFLGERWVIEPLHGTTHTFDLRLGGVRPPADSHPFYLQKCPLHYSDFLRAFDEVVQEINYGNSFLTNLTFKTPIKTNLTLSNIHSLSQAKYKLLTDDFVVFSPETFIQIKDEHIYSYPMKGTISASLPNARERILADPKELAEHVTIVDLIRNDLSRVSENVSVTRFRYIDKITTRDTSLLQVSSEIKGRLHKGWQSSLGTLLSLLLPAGSISGAPKPQTIKIIQHAEAFDRGFYTGICGTFDGATLDTGVMIRFVQKEDEQLFYLSGGGITSFSDPAKEYQEMVDKIYLPIS